MKINIICTDVGWIYSKFISMFRQYSKHQILLNQTSSDCDVTHYLPYYEMPASPKAPCTAWLSHQELRKDLYDKFIYAARTADFNLSHSKKYKDILEKEHNITNTKQIIPGVDFYKFQLRSTERPPQDKLIVGYVGRQYSSSNRKNPNLIHKIASLPFVNLKVTDGKIKEENMPKFYAGLDLVISPATIEGGPMCLHESLAVGVPVLCFESVGVANEFELGTIKVQFGNDEEFISKLRLIWEEKTYISPYRQIDIMQHMRDQVKNYTWENFVSEHDNIWEMIASKKDEKI